MKLSPRSLRAWTLLVIANFLAVSGTTLADDDELTIDVVVDPRANGGFGPLLGGVEVDPAVQEMVHAISLGEDETVTITAAGTVILNVANPASTTVDANGGVQPFRNGFLYFPLEEADVDLNGTLPDSPVLDVGALMGAFISTDDTDSDDDGTSFLARNNDPNPFPGAPPGAIPDPPIVGDIPSEALFLIGAGPFVFRSPDDGILLLGVNDTFTPNNAGAFVVTISVGGNDDDDDSDSDSDSDSD